MFAERTDADYAAIQTPLREPIAGLMIASASADDLYIPEDTHVRSEARPTFSRVAATRPQPRPIESAPARPRVQPKFENAAIFRPVIITYDRTGALTDTQALGRPGKTDAAMQRRRPERSLVAKVALKPYEWAKSIASRLN